MIHRFAVIFSESAPEGDPFGFLAHVDATSAGAVQDECNRAVAEEGSVWYGCQFTIWPDPVETF